MAAKRTIVLLVVLLALAASAGAWYRHGHVLSSRAAVVLASDRLPVFFAAGVEMIAHVSQDNDAFTRPIAPQELHE
ncbi:MAG: hypothetical protein MUP47_03440, partial [Phycisphaerae bacterium]|nr:hypothetical protein [Phycisphaerae bacterium]